MLNQTLFTHLQALFPQVELDRELTKIQIDSRNCGEGSIFFAFKGEHTDGRLYVQEVVCRGGLVVCDLKNFPDELPNSERISVVEDIYETVENLTISITKELKAKGGRVIGVTGSSGKTFCKNAMVKILSDAGHSIASTIANFNTDLGLFLSLAEMGDEVDYLILELGVGKPGDMDLLGKVIKSDLILLLDIAHAHAGNFCSRDLLVKEKLKLIKYRGNNAKVVAHENLRKDISKYYPTVEVEYYTNELVFSMTSEAPEASGEMNIYGEKHVIHCPNLYGEHYLENFLGIILLLKSTLDIERITKSLEGLENEPGRGLLVCDLLNPVNGTVFNLYDSSYNANPGKNGSMLRELETIKKFKGKKVLVLGECREILESEKFHQEILEFAQGISEKIILIGKSWDPDFPQNINNDNVKCVVNEVLHNLSEGGLLFVKGSNGTGLFRYFVPELQRLCQKNTP